MIVNVKDCIVFPIIVVSRLYLIVSPVYLQEARKISDLIRPDVQDIIHIYTIEQKKRMEQ